MPVIQWSIDPKDIRAKPRVIMTRLKNRLHDGGIALLHDTRKGTTQAIPLIAQMLLDEGYLTVTVEELAAMHGRELQPGKVYFRFRAGEP